MTELSASQIFFALFLCLALLTAADASAVEGTLDSASLSAPFENIEGSARSAGLGGALLYAPDDAAVLLQNPAVLGELQTGQISLHHNSWIADIVEETVALGVPLGVLGGLGAQADYVNYGHFQGYDDFGNPTSALGASDLGLGLGYGRRLTPWMTGGLDFKTVQQTLADASFTTYAMDFGLVLHPLPSLDLAAAYNGFGSGVGGAQRATVLRLGADWREGQAAVWNSLVAVSVDLRPLDSSQVHLGGELEFSDRYFFRAGYSYNLAQQELTGLANLAVGTGAWISSVRLDYSYLPFGEFGGVQRISLAYAYGKPNEPLAVVKAAPTPQATPQTAAAAVAPGIEFVVKVPAQDLEAARNLAAKGLLKEAVLAYNDALATDPGNASAWRELGEIYFKLGKKDFALQCFDESVRLKPDADLQHWLAKYRYKME